MDWYWIVGTGLTIAIIVVGAWADMRVRVGKTEVMVNNQKEQTDKDLDETKKDIDAMHTKIEGDRTKTSENNGKIFELLSKNSINLEGIKVMIEAHIKNHTK